MKMRFIDSVITLSLSLILTASCACQGGREGVRTDAPAKKIVAYYPSYKAGGRILSVERLSLVTHVNLSFAILGADGSLDDARVRKSYEAMKDSLRAAGVKVLVSVGGGGGPVVQKNFATVISDSLSRAAAVDALMGLTDDLGLDGLDIDYEAWNISGFDNAALEVSLEEFLRLLRERLGEERLLTAAVADYGSYNGNMARYFDYITVMAYDLTGPWMDHGGPHAPYEFFTGMMKKFEAMGFPKEKLVGGVPFYGYGFPEGGEQKDFYSMTFDQIVEKFPGAEMMDCVNDELFYNGLPTMEKKCDFVLDNNYGGIMFWEITQDTEIEDKSLLVLINSKMSM